ncbi:glycoside hydrolase family 18 protein [Bacillus sp. LBG-1-113]|uniref:glycoside hydrolase family 18 protein n=1 Tax=Bacillus sp. LBG-1-113 TaxID=2886094 RepID=UPI001E2FCA27|nr:glycoside hydrolase family 18 protein [Bacillus sp. LBG-1-113]MCC2931549.1 glycoside hydrolase family 18 protein [Bacillus sp. LBG-1-113]
MFIHIVRPGDSLFSIGRRYGASVDQIRGVNGLEETNIVPGQALLIPLYVYTVQPGDTLAAIAAKSFVPAERLRAANPAINPNALQAGMRLTIPNISNYIAGTLSFYVLRNPDLDRDLINDYAPYSSSISIFEYHIAPNGDIANELNDAAAIETTWRRRVTPLATITNLTSAGFSTELVRQVLNNPTARTNLVNNIYNLVSTRGYGGVMIDFEKVSAADRDLFTGFLRQLRDRLQPGGYVLTIAVPAKTSDDISWLRGYDYGGIGAVVNYMFIMAYDWHHAGSEPGPVAPITEIRRTIEFAIAQVPRRKIIIGVPLYGYNWIIPYQTGTVASAISNQKSIETAMRYQAPIQYSNEYQSPFFRYRDEQGRTHEVWFEDVRSMSQKMLIVREYGLQAIGAWQLTLGFTPAPWLLRKFFTIRKV